MNQKVDEQVIMERTGHRSTTAVRMYKRTSSEMQKEVSDILQPPPPKSTSSAEASSTASCSVASAADSSLSASATGIDQARSIPSSSTSDQLPSLLTSQPPLAHLLVPTPSLPPFGASASVNSEVLPGCGQVPRPSGHSSSSSTDFTAKSRSPQLKPKQCGPKVQAHMKSTANPPKLETVTASVCIPGMDPLVLTKDVDSIMISVTKGDKTVNILI